MEPMEEVPLKELCESELAMIRARAKKNQVGQMSAVSEDRL